MDPLMLLQQWWQELDQSTLFNPILLSLLLIFTFRHFLKLTRTNKLNPPPSPPKLPIIGNLHQIGKLPHRTFQTLSEKYGPLMLLHFGYSPVLIVSSAEIAGEITKTNEVAFAGRPQIRAANDLFYGCTDIAFCPYWEYWRQVKKICVLEILSQRRVQEFQFVREEEVAKMVEKIRLSCLNGKAVDLSEMFVRIANDIVSRSALGQIYEGEEGDESFGELSRRAMGLMAAVCFEDLFPLMGWIDVLTGFSANLKRTSKALHAFIDQVIEDHRVSKSDDDKSGKKDFVDILLQLQKDGMLDINLTQDNLKAILLDMFVGGTDTTATTMEWAMAEIVKNPSVMKKAQEEVRRVVGKKSKVDEMDIDKMDYLKCIIKETLRLHAPVMVTREKSASAKLAGYDIPPKTTILINAWAIQRDPKLWDRPEDFIPERFANISVDFKGQHNQLMPFGGGRRGCPGIFFAIAEVEFVLANLLYWFDWHLSDGATVEELDMSEVYGLVIRKKIPLRLVPAMHSP